MFTLTRDRRSVAVLVLCLVAAAPASAAVDIYMSITGAKQGSIKGEGKAPGPGQWLKVISVTEPGSASSGDAATGMATGKRQHETIRVVKEVGGSSPQLQRALATGEVLKEVVFEFYRPTGKGQNELYETIRLNDALISSIQRRAEANASHGAPQEEITFEYEKIQISHNQGKNSTTPEKLNDTWKK